VEQGWTVSAAAAAANVSRQTASKWVHRFLAEGAEGLKDRSTRPHRVPRRVPAAIVRRIERLRRQRLGSHRIAWVLGLARSTVHRVLCRLGLQRLSRLDPKPAANRYEWPVPGDLVHLDTKKLGRMGGRSGKRFDPRQRGVDRDVDERPSGPVRTSETTVGFFLRARSFYAGVGIEVRRVLTDNGNPYRSTIFPAELTELGIRHIRTRPSTPRTNGKAEAMVKILLNGWAYARPFRSDEARSAALPRFVDLYDHARPHGGLNGARPIDRVRQ
jgi:transposase InsO family protein